MIANSPIHDQSRIRKFACYDIRRDFSCLIGIICYAVLLSTKKDITRNRPLYRSKKTTMLCKKRYTYVIICTESKQKRRTKHSAKAYDSAQCVDRQLKDLLLFFLNYDSFAFFVNI